MNSIAVLITCHNRCKKTIACLQSLVECQFPEDFLLDVYLVDDGSTDGTANAVSEKFPFVNIIYGDGFLYWNQGMRLAWENAAAKKEYDYYFWLNDDTLVDKHAITELLECSIEAIEKSSKPAVIVGSCRASNNSNEYSYGGRTNKEPIIPNGQLQVCEIINGNAVLIPKAIYNTIGNLSPDYTHAIGDNDYGLSATKAGYKCYTSKTYIATCSPNKQIPGWCNPEESLSKRLRLLHSTKGLNIKEYNAFCRKFWGWKWIYFSFKVYIKAIFPSTYSKLPKF